MARKRQSRSGIGVLNCALLVFLQIVSRICGQLNDDCPTDYPGCSCLQQQFPDIQITCTQLGVIDSVPGLNASDFNYSQLSIETNTRIRHIQAHAFQGLSVRSLTLSRLGTRSIDEDGFRGLKTDILESISLDQNLLRSIAPRTFAGFTQMTQLHLENNNIKNLDGNVFSDLIRLSRLYLSYNRIDVLPEPLFSRMTALSELRLSSNILSEIKNNVFVNLNRLNYLDLSKNRISSIDADVFQSTTSLRNLVLTGNQLSTLNSGLFRNLNSLTNLDLSRNNLNYIGAETLAGLSSLTTLKLGRNCLITLPADLLTFQNRLLTLDLTQNGIRTLPVGLFHNKTTITSLTLEQNFISSLPSSVFDGLSSLTALNIQSNRIKVIRNDTFSYLRSLATLDLSDNLIDTIEPECFGFSNKLNKITLKGNRLVAIQSGIFVNLPSIGSINLQQNSIKSLSIAAFSNLSTLSQLILSSNTIQELAADTFDDSPSIRSVYLTGNQLINFPVDFVRRQSALTNLFLDGNNISTIPDDAYDNFKSVSVVLNNNRITSIPYGAFGGTLSITDIMLQRNQITDIADNVFRGWRTEKITRLILNNNLLTTIRAEMFIGLRGLQELDLSNNKISFLNDNCFSALSTLQILNLAGNRLVSLTPAVFTGIGSNALSLNLDSNNLTDSSLSSFAVLHGIVSLVLNNNNINQLSGIIDVPFVNLTNLELRNNNLTSLNANIFSRMPSLSTLDLGNNHLDSTALTAVEVLNNLGTLKLDHNVIGNISMDVSFKGVLKYLDLSFNHIDSDVFLLLENINSLEELRLDGNQIGRIWDITANISFPNLTVLSANNNSLITADLLLLTGNPSLTKLYIDDNAIESVLPGIFLDKFNLNTLSMSNNLLSIINASTFDGFEMSGKILNLSGNGITDIEPEALLNFVGLQHLDLSSNRLKRIALPTQMASLQVLRIDNNNLTDFPEGPWAFSGGDSSAVLMLLNVSHNQLTSMSNLTIYGDSNTGSGPKILFQENRLKNIDGLVLVGSYESLDLKNNYIEDVPPQLLKRVLNIALLNLSSNFLTDIPDTVCNASHAIAYLSMSSNSIASVCHLNGIPDLPSNIDTLDLSYNQLNYVHPTFWPFLGSALRNLNLSHNNLTTLNGSDVQTYCTELKTLYLDGNEWNCDCNMLWLRITAATVDVDWPVCSAPPANEGVPLECYAIDNCSFSQSTRLNERCNSRTERASEFPPVIGDSQSSSESNGIAFVTWPPLNVSSTHDIQPLSKSADSGKQNNEIEASSVSSALNDSSTIFGITESFASFNPDKTSGEIQSTVSESSSQTSSLSSTLPPSTIVSSGSFETKPENKTENTLSGSSYSTYTAEDMGNGSTNLPHHLFAEGNFENDTTSLQPLSTTASSNASMPTDQSHTIVSESLQSSKYKDLITIISTLSIPSNTNSSTTSSVSESEIPSTTASTSLDTTTDGSSMSPVYLLLNATTQESTSPSLSFDNASMVISGEDTSRHVLHNASDTYFTNLAPSRHTPGTVSSISFAKISISGANPNMSTIENASIHSTTPAAVSTDADFSITTKNRDETASSAKLGSVITSWTRFSSIFNISTFGSGLPKTTNNGSSERAVTATTHFIMQTSLNKSSPFFNVTPALNSKMSAIVSGKSSTSSLSRPTVSSTKPETSMHPSNTTGFLFTGGTAASTRSSATRTVVTASSLGPSDDNTSIKSSIPSSRNSTKVTNSMTTFSLQRDSPLNVTARSSIILVNITSTQPSMPPRYSSDISHSNITKSYNYSEVSKSTLSTSTIAAITSASVARSDNSSILFTSPNFSASPHATTNMNSSSDNKTVFTKAPLIITTGLTNSPNSSMIGIISPTKSSFNHSNSTVRSVENLTSNYTTASIPLTASPSNHSNFPVAFTDSSIPMTVSTILKSTPKSNDSAITTTRYINSASNYTKPMSPTVPSSNKTNTAVTSSVTVSSKAIPSVVTSKRINITYTPSSRFGSKATTSIPLSTRRSNHTNTTYAPSGTFSRKVTASVPPSTPKSIYTNRTVTISFGLGSNSSKSTSRLATNYTIITDNRFGRLSSNITTSIHASTPSFDHTDITVMPSGTSLVSNATTSVHTSAPSFNKTNTTLTPPDSLNSNVKVSMTTVTSKYTNIIITHANATMTVRTSTPIFNHTSSTAAHTGTFVSNTTISMNKSTPRFNNANTTFTPPSSLNSIIVGVSTTPASTVTSKYTTITRANSGTLMSNATKSVYTSTPIFNRANSTGALDSNGTTSVHISTPRFSNANTTLPAPVNSDSNVDVSMRTSTVTLKHTNISGTNTVMPSGTFGSDNTTSNSPPAPTSTHTYTYVTSPDSLDVNVNTSMPSEFTSNQSTSSYASIAATPSGSLSSNAVTPMQPSTTSVNHNNVTVASSSTFDSNDTTLVPPPSASDHTSNTSAYSTIASSFTLGSNVTTSMLPSMSNYSATTVAPIVDLTNVSLQLLSTSSLNYTGILKFNVTADSSNLSTQGPLTSSYATSLFSSASSTIRPTPSTRLTRRNTPTLSSTLRTYTTTALSSSDQTSVQKTSTSFGTFPSTSASTIVPFTNASTTTPSTISSASSTPILEGSTSTSTNPQTSLTSTPTSQLTTVHAASSFQSPAITYTNASISSAEIGSNSSETITVPIVPPSSPSSTAAATTMTTTVSTSTTVSTFPSTSDSIIVPFTNASTTTPSIISSSPSSTAAATTMTTTVSTSTTTSPTSSSASTSVTTTATSTTLSSLLSTRIESSSVLSSTQTPSSSYSTSYPITTSATTIATTTRTTQVSTSASVIRPSSTTNSLVTSSSIPTDSPSLTSIWSNVWSSSQTPTPIETPAPPNPNQQQAEGGGSLSERDKIILGAVLGTGLFMILIGVIAAVLCAKYHKNVARRKNAYQVNGARGIEMNGYDNLGLAHYQDSKASI